MLSQSGSGQPSVCMLAVRNSCLFPKGTLSWFLIHLHQCKTCIRICWRWHCEHSGLKTAIKTAILVWSLADASPHSPCNIQSRDLVARGTYTWTGRYRQLPNQERSSLMNLLHVSSCGERLVIYSLGLFFLPETSNGDIQYMCKNQMCKCGYVKLIDTIFQEPTVSDCHL